MKIGVYNADGQLQSEHDVTADEPIDLVVEPNGIWAQLVNGQVLFHHVGPQGLTLRGLRASV